MGYVKMKVNLRTMSKVSILFLALILWRCCCLMVNVLAMDQHPIQGYVEILLVASYY